MGSTAEHSRSGGERPLGFAPMARERATIMRNSVIPGAKLARKGGRGQKVLFKVCHACHMTLGEALFKVGMWRGQP